MTRKQRRGMIIGGAVVLGAAVVLLVAVALRDYGQFFRTPSDVTAQSVPAGERFRLGGLISEGSIKRLGHVVEFSITDTIKTIPVVFKGELPALVGEGKGIVAVGKLDSQGVFIADTVLAKHDENYLPPEVASALKEKGVKLGKGAVHKSPGQ